MAAKTSVCMKVELTPAEADVLNLVSHLTEKPVEDILESWLRNSAEYRLMERRLEEMDKHYSEKTQPIQADPVEEEPKQADPVEEKPVFDRVVEAMEKMDAIREKEALQMKIEEIQEEIEKEHVSRTAIRNTAVSNDVIVKWLIDHEKSTIRELIIALYNEEYAKDQTFYVRVYGRLQALIKKGVLTRRKYSLWNPLAHTKIVTYKYSASPNAEKLMGYTE